MRVSDVRPACLPEIDGRHTHITSRQAAQHECMQAGRAAAANLTTTIRKGWTQPIDGMSHQQHTGEPYAWMDSGGVVVGEVSCCCCLLCARAHSVTPSLPLLKAHESTATHTTI